MRTDIEKADWIAAAVIGGRHTVGELRKGVRSRSLVAIKEAREEASAKPLDLVGWFLKDGDHLTVAGIPHLGIVR